LALRSTEAEFAAAADAGKATLYLRSILYELGVEQLLPTVIYEDNNDARLMTNAQQPTQRTRLVELKQFAVLQWVEDEQIIFGDIGIPRTIFQTRSRNKQDESRANSTSTTVFSWAAYAQPTVHPKPLPGPTNHIRGFSFCLRLLYIDTYRYDYFDLDLDAVTRMGR
jgi:hypothetical protein